MSSKGDFAMNPYFSALCEVINKKYEKDNKPVPLDFSNPTDYNCICEMCGGGKIFQNEFPNLYEVTENTRNHYRNGSENNDANPEGGFTNLIYINDCSYDKENKKLYAFGNINLTKKVKRVYVTLTVFNKNSKNEDQVIGFNSIFGRDCSSLLIDCTNQDFELSDYNIKTVIQATWEDDSHLLNSYVDSKTLEYSLVEIIDKDGIQVNDPRHINSSSEDDINVCYARQPIAKERIDYIYPEDRTKEGHQKVYLDNSGSAILKKGYTFVKAIPRGVNMILSCPGAGGIYYEVEAPEQYVKKNAKGFEWQFPVKWKNYIPESIRYGNRRYKFEMEIQFYVNENSNKYEIIVSSYVNPQPTDHHKKISDIHLWWGCVAEDTEIMMENGTRKKIQDVKIGESVVTGPDGSTEVVENIWKGTDERMYCVNCNNKQIYASKDHPFVTREGLKTLIYLSDTDELLMEDGNYYLIHYGYPLQDKMNVYNLDLSGEIHTMICNGFVVGDNISQGKILEQLNQEDNSYSDFNETDEEEIESQKLMERLLIYKQEIEKGQDNEKY